MKSYIQQEIIFILICSAIIYLNLLSVSIEGYFFTKYITLNGLLYNIISLALVTSAVSVIASHLYQQNNCRVMGALSKRRKIFAWTWRIIIASLVYIIVYYLFGGINFILVTKPYYMEHRSSLILPPAESVLKAELIRAPLMILSAIPFILARQNSVRSRKLAILTGLQMFIAGGIVPLVLASELPFFLRLASLWEIFLQNFILGYIAAFLLKIYRK